MFQDGDLVIVALSCRCPVQVMFARPLPALSRQLNAWVTALTCQWLMGPCQVNDVELADGKALKSQGVKIERWGNAWEAHSLGPVHYCSVHLFTWPDTQPSAWSELVPSKHREPCPVHLLVTA